MNTGFIVVSAILVAALFVPFFAFSSSKRLSKCFKQTLQELERTNGLKIGSFDYGDNYFIGMSQDEATLLFMRREGEEVLSQVLIIDEILSCREVIVSHRSNYKGEQHTVVDRVSLQFRMKKGRPADAEWVFYDAEKEMFAPTNEELIAMKWEQIVGR